jgi:hypothetical protein
MGEQYAVPRHGNTQDGGIRRGEDVRLLRSDFVSTTLETTQFAGEVRVEARAGKETWRAQGSPAHKATTWRRIGINSAKEACDCVTTLKT